MTHMFELHEDEIASLGEVAFVDVLNHLLRADAARHGLSAGHIHTSLRTKDPDGGVDARVDAPGVQGSQYLPPRLCIWQFKAGKADLKALRREAAKRGVVEALGQQGYYRVAVGYAYGDRARKSRDGAIRGGAEAAVGAPLSADATGLLTASDIAAWASQYPAVLRLDYFGRPFGDLLTFTAWSNQVAHRIPYSTDPTARRVIESVRQQLIAPGEQWHVAIAGNPGVGLTRFALEVLRDTDAAALTLYAPSRLDIPQGLFGWLASHHTTYLCLVVDNCEWDDVTRLHQLAEPAEGRARLVTISARPRIGSAAHIPVVALEGLSDEAMRALVTHAGAAFPDTSRRIIVRMAGGYPKLAVGLCLAIAGSTGMMERMSSFHHGDEIQSVIQSFLPEAKQRQVLRSMAALTRVGVSGDVVAEARALATFVGMPVDEWQSVMHDLERRGLLVGRGRYRQVTPHLLAVWLASEFWNERADDITDSLLPSLPPPARVALLERLGDIGEHPATMELANAILSHLLADENWTHLYDGSVERLFEASVHAVTPVQAVAKIEAYLTDCSREQLLSMTGMKRHSIVAELGKLAWFPASFSRSARLLLRLADAESATWANNASGTWLGLFKTHLGGTSVPVSQRMPMLDDALGAPSVRVRRLAVAALGQMLSHYEVRNVGSEDQGGRIVPAEWHPASLEEDREARCAALHRLDRALTDEDTEVVASARKVLLDSTRFLIHIGLFDEVLAQLHTLPYANHAERLQLRRCIELALAFEHSGLTLDQQEALRAYIALLAGSSLPERLRRWVGEWTFADRQQETQAAAPDTPAKQAITQLAAELAAQPSSLSQDDWQWLFSPAAENAWLLGEALGQQDPHESWLPLLLPRLTPLANHLLFAGYLWGNTSSVEDDWRDDVLDELDRDHPELAELIMRVTWAGPARERGARRVIRYVEQGLLGGLHLSMFAWRDWPRALSGPSYQRLTTLSTEGAKGVSTEGPLTMLHQRLCAHPEECETLRQSARDLLRRVDGASCSTMALFYWQEIANRYVAVDPTGLATLIFEQLESVSGIEMIPQEALAVLHQATRLAPGAIWPIAREALFREDAVGNRLQLSLQGAYITLFDQEDVLAWARMRQPNGPAIAASLVDIDEGPLHALPRALLAEYGSDSTVGRTLVSRVDSGALTNPASVCLKRKLMMVELWEHDPLACVREWVAKVKHHLEEQLRAAIMQEHES